MGGREPCAQEESIPCGTVFERISQHVESEISVTGVAVEAGDQKMIMLSVDIVSLTPGVIRLAREKFSELCPEVDPRNLIPAATHSHTSLKMGNPYANESDVRSWNTFSILEEFLPED